MNVLITGASSGIGLALAQTFAKHAPEKRPLNLVLIGRKPLSELHHPLLTSHTYCTVDITHPEAVATITAQLQARKIGQLDMIIHNAGVGYYGTVTEQSQASIAQLLQTNLYTPITLTHALMPQVKKGRGKVVFISSVAAHGFSPDFGVYIASKAALDGFARSLRAERDVRVQVIHPGATQTDIFAKSGMTPEQIAKVKAAPADEVAQTIYKRIMHADNDLTVGFDNKLLSYLTRWFAPIVDRAVCFQAQRKAQTRVNPSPLKRPAA